MHDDHTQEPKTFIEGRDFYFEGGLMVLTRTYLLERGYCCTNSCRHCPYDESKKEDLQFLAPLD